MKPRLLYVRVIAGVLLAAISIFSTNILERFGYGLPWTKTRQSSWAIHATHHPKGREFPQPHLVVDFPDTMRVSEKGEVTVAFTWKDDTKPVESVSATLVSASFDVTPKETISKTLSDSHSASFAWTTTPKSEGRGKLQLDISYEVTTDDEIYKEHRTVEQGVNVFRIRNQLSARTYHGFRAVGLGLGFILVLSVFFGTIRRIFFPLPKQP